MEPRSSKTVSRRTAADDADDTGRLTAGVAGACVFLAGMWLVLSPFVLDHEKTGNPFAGYSNDVLVGMALVASGAASLVEPNRGRWWDSARPLVGVWLLVAPFALGYNAGAPAPGVTTSDLAVGTFVLLICFVVRAPSESSPRQRSDDDLPRN
ncbi:SPW repeat domain-containing protein [Amycolatopsis keratiniphila]|uniref:SPW repeat-containing integral membrane domain-containing protein n=1 Tax=Amycolatopsis keratiniphila subsp. keratiniphila TaxID=227715 RepID=A0A1W2LYY9_9PSEU|nr:SPW repeat protein [Amycolatopsis keratiniphila]OLZ58120.1 hypothetical protein BS330_12890 [Amycolatopsis keratiniphila subsp. nogabecina]ONF72174.1 hypothetical protein AVR91_0211620 [Amycolatopsis keratiniphila subsp. keratiniphila]SDU44241.1 SPW repeat-containing protein [Amycolatopsis keratiniphila]